MKKLIAVAVAVAAVFTLVPTKAEAGYRSKVIGHCNHCNSSIHSYYRPVRYSDGCVRYTWVPSYHSNCSSRSYHSRSYHYGRSYYRPTPRYYGSNRGCSTPGVTLRFGRSSFSFR